MDGLVTDPESRTILLPASGLFRTAVGAKRLLDQVSATGGQAPIAAHPSAAVTRATLSLGLAVHPFMCSAATNQLRVDLAAGWPSVAW